MRIMAHDLPVLAGARFGFVGVDHQIAGRPSDSLGMKDHFSPVGKARAAPPAQAGGLHDLHDLVAAQTDQVLGAIPMAARFRARKATVVHAIDIGKDPVLVLKHLASLAYL
jgi:hypothetical protein